MAVIKRWPFSEKRTLHVYHIVNLNYLIVIAAYVHVWHSCILLSFK